MTRSTSLTLSTCCQSLDKRYFQFGKDIESLASGLDRLNLIITNANDQRPARPWQNDDDATAGVVNTLSKITGDFKQTLQDCDVLLKDNSKFKRSAANFVDNVVWHASTERDVDSLRKRLRFHMMKINFIAKPFEIQLLSGISRELQQLRREVAAVRAVLDWDPARTSRPINSHPQESYLHVPRELSDRFGKALAAKDPDLSQVRDGLPLKQGFDAVVYHFSRSTVNFKPSVLGQDVPEEQYLNLLKSKWIIERLQENTRLGSPDPEPLWAEYMRELEDELRTQFLRFQQEDLLQPPLDALIRLPDKCFSIWDDEESSPPPAALTEHRPSDEKILELPLQSLHSTHRSTLTIFRKSDSNFRLVSATRDDQNNNFLQEESMDVNMIQTGLVPVFAASQDTSTVNTNVLLCNQGQDTKFFNLRDRADVDQFQRALTGFRVSHDMSNVSWHIEFNRFSKSGISGKARLQLWHLKPLSKVHEPQGNERLERRKSFNDQTPHSPVGSHKLRRFWTSGTALPASSIASLVNGSRGAGIALTSPEPPVLVIFTKCGDKYAFLHLRCMSMDTEPNESVHFADVKSVDRGIRLEHQPCESCRKQRSQCSRILIRSTAKKFTSITSKFTIRRLCAQQKNEQGLDGWNLGCFRYPEHPEFKNLELLSIKYLSLHFETLDSE